MKSSDICCIVVAFNPDLEQLCKVIESILQWSQRVILVDNTPNTSYCADVLDKYDLDIIQLRENIGIGAAQNIGILKAASLGCDWIVLSDQDTLYPENYGLLMKSRLQMYENACAIAPTFIDVHRSDEAIIKAKVPAWHGWQKISPPGRVFDLYEAAASGLMLKVSSLQYVGLMNEQLFIDWVDFEWCWRARAAGFRVLGASDIKVNHSLGIGAISLGGKFVNVRPPIRHYYIVRNCIYLAIYSNFLNIFIRIRLLFKSLIFIAGYSLLFSPRLVNLYSVIAGFKDGVLGRLGKRF
jgi:rhamnosyltransferase